MDKFYLIMFLFRFDTQLFEAFYLSDVEIVNFKDDSVCQKPPNFPLELYGAVGAFIDDRC